MSELFQFLIGKVQQGGQRELVNKKLTCFNSS